MCSNNFSQSKRPHNYLISLFIILVSLFSSLICRAESINLKSFYEDPVLSGVVLSPDGKQLAGIRHHDGNTTIMVYNVDTKKSAFLMTSDNIKMKFNWLRWAENSRHLLTSIRFNSIERGIVFGETRLLSLDTQNNGKSVNMFEPDAKASKLYPGWISQFQDNIVCSKPSEPNFVWIAVDRERPNVKGVYKVNVTNGRMSPAMKARSFSRDWILDRDCEARISQHFNDDTRRISYKILDKKTKDWKDAWSYTALEEQEIVPLGFGGNKDEVYLSADNNGYLAIYKVNLTSPDLKQELIYANENYDVYGSLIYSKRLNDVVGIHLFGGANQPIYWNEEFKSLQAGIDKSLPDSRNILSSLSNDERRYILESQGQKNPGMILYGNRDAKTLDLISSDYPSISDEQLPKKEWIKYNARDGLAIDAVVSKPVNAANKPLPTIVFPHGGPMASDGTGFDMFTTYFTSKGYVVIQPNFRGSSGRGFDYMRHAVGGFGLAMQDDLEDGVNHLIKQGITDPKKICIVGASYGGYAALMGATKTPDLFRCAVSFAGLSDLKEMHRKARYFMNKNVMREQLGNDKNQLELSSPINFVEKIKIPVLLIHGAKDSTVDVYQSRDMAAKLKKLGKNYNYIELENGTHYLDNLDDRKVIFEAIDKFLDSHLPIQ